MKYLCLYCPKSNDINTIKKFSKKFECVPLTDDPLRFYGEVQKLDFEGELVVLSHGGSGGFMITQGDTPSKNDVLEDKTLTTLAIALNARHITLYLLSCFTGMTADSETKEQLTARKEDGTKERCADILLREEVKFIAPIGNAAIRADAICVTIKSTLDGKPAGWTSSESLKSLVPTRNSKPLEIPLK